MEDNSKPSRIEWLRKKMENPNFMFIAGAGIGMTSLIVGCNLRPQQVAITKDMLQEWIEDPTLHLHSARHLTGKICVVVKDAIPAE